MAVPSTFTKQELKDGLAKIKSAIKKGRCKNGRIMGNPYIFYSDLLPLGYHIESKLDSHNAGVYAGLISEMEYEDSGLLISAVVVSKEFLRPGKGFYHLAQDYGLFTIPSIEPDADGIVELTFWAKHVGEIVEYYGRQNIW